MYANRKSKAWVEGMHAFLAVAEQHRRNGFIDCPCANCKNEKNYSDIGTLHTHTCLKRASCAIMFAGPITEKKGL